MRPTVPDDRDPSSGWPNNGDTTEMKKRIREYNGQIEYAAAMRPTTYLSRELVTTLTVWLLIVSACGCGRPPGPERAEIKGTVTLDGEPLEQGGLQLFPAEGTQGPTAGSQIVNGKYHVAREKGPVLGTYRVVITSVRKTGKKVPLGPESLSPHAPPTAMVDDVEQYIPARYNKQSELRAEIESGTNEVNFQLKSQ